VRHVVACFVANTAWWRHRGLNFVTLAQCRAASRAHIHRMAGCWGLLVAHLIGTRPEVMLAHLAGFAKGGDVKEAFAATLVKELQQTDMVGACSMLVEYLHFFGRCSSCCCSGVLFGGSCEAAASTHHSTQ
jgi:predicted benzoate:H+ symporter BenE